MCNELQETRIDDKGHARDDHKPADKRRLESKAATAAATIAKRLESHNRLEEELAYVWTSLLFDEQELAALRTSIAHKLESLQTRLA